MIYSLNEGGERKMKEAQDFYLSKWRGRHPC